MGEKVDVRQFETGMAALMEKIQLPGPDGNPMPAPQKQQMLCTFVMLALMN